MTTMTIDRPRALPRYLLRWTALVSLALALSACSTRIPKGNNQNLILVTIDTLRADYLGCYGYPQVVSPNLDRLAGEGILFERAYSTAPFTGPSHASILTGQHPSTHGIIYNGHNSPALFSGQSVPLAEHLGRHGFTTSGLVSAGPLDARFGFDRGFDTYSYVRKPDHGDKGGGARHVNAEARRWLEKRRPGERFFLWIHYFDPHLPYACEPDILETFGVTSEAPDHENVRTLPAENLRDHYRAEVYEADRFLGTLLSTLDQLKLSDETIVALTADHGEYLGEHGGFVDHHQLFDQVLHVPMILRWKALEGGQRRTVPVSTIDLAPTLVEALGVEPLPGAQGRSLLDPGAEELPVFAEWRHFHMLEKDAKPRPNDFLVMVQKGTRKYVHDVLFPEKSAFYDLLVDPAETEDRSPSDEGAARELKALLELHLHKDLPRGLLGVDEIHIDEQSLEMLRSLGYVE